MKILIADDDASLRLLLRAWLEEAGHQVDEVEAGDLAIARLGVTPYDLLLLDINMPGMDGIEVAMKLQERHLEVKVVVMSGGGIAMPAGLGLKVASMFGVEASLVKPFRREDLLAVLDKVAGAAV